MRNRLSLMGLTRSSSKKRRKSKGYHIDAVGKWQKTLKSLRKRTKETIDLDIDEKRSNMKDKDKKIGLNFSDSADDQTPLSLLLRNKKDLNSEFKEIEDAEKVRENDIGGKEVEGKFGDSYEVRESYESDITKMGEKDDITTVDRKSSMGMENSMDEDSEDNQRVPCGDVTIESITKLKIKDESVKAWRNRYPRNFMAPSELVSNIENAEDDDSFNFMLDFLLLNDRQKWEIEHGGFGKGKYKGLSKVIVDEVEGNIGYSVVNTGTSEVHAEAIVRKTNDQIKSVLEDLANNSGTYDETRDLANESENDNCVGDVPDDQEEPEDPQDENENCADDVQDEQEEPEDPQVNAELKNSDAKDSQENAKIKNVDEMGLGELYASDDTISLGHCEIGETTHCQDTVQEQASVEAVTEKEDTTNKTQDGNETAKEGNTEVANKLNMYMMALLLALA
ncbi:hypothetical protein L1987_87047 [Smallanthus sonchifolius]|nr:hypothetical protein L1987_87047 [Smallanthus sonchifolius]